MADIIAWIILGLISVLCGILLYNQRGFHPDRFELLEDEEILRQSKGDYWTEDDAIEFQNQGEFAFTNKRIMFRGMFLVSQDKNVDISYEEIESIEFVNIAKFLPTGFLVTTKDGDEYKFSMMKRQEFVDFINSQKDN